MTNFILALVLLIFAKSAVVIRHAYNVLPAKELKRRAEHGDNNAKRLYRAVAYGASLRVFLWLVIGVTSAGGVVLLARVAPPWLGLLAVLAFLLLNFYWQPASKINGLGMRFALLATPGIAWILNYVHPMFSRGSAVVDKRRTPNTHTGMFERDDLLELIARQADQHDNRITAEELTIVTRALHFGDFSVTDVLTPRKQIKTLLASDTIGPILIDEVHRSGQQEVLVRESPKGAFVGLLQVTKLGLQSNGSIGDVMDPHVYYLHEQDTLSEALHAFFVTNQPLFIVVNSFDEYVGIVTIENILKQLLGHLPGNSFDQYTDREAVAARHTKVEETATEESNEPEVVADPEML